MEKRNGKWYLKGTDMLIRYYQYMFQDGWDICCMTLSHKEIKEPRNAGWSEIPERNLKGGNRKGATPYTISMR